MPFTRSGPGSSAVTMTTGSMAVAGLSRSFRQTSYPLMPGIMTSRSTRSGPSRSTQASASAPLVAVSTA